MSSKDNIISLDAARIEALKEKGLHVIDEDSIPPSSDYGLGKGGPESGTSFKRLKAAGLAGLVAITSLAILQRFDSAPKAGEPIATRVTGPAKSGDLVVDIQKGDVTHGMLAIGDSEGLHLGLSDPRLVENSSDIALYYSDNSSGDVSPGTSFTVRPSHPITDPKALKEYEPGIDIRQIK